MEVLYFASPKWVYMLKSGDKRPCKTPKYKTLVGGHLELLLRFEVLFLKIQALKTQDRREIVL
jgi:hypothetical protein